MKHISPDDMERLLVGPLSLVDRRDLLVRLMEQAWQEGWDACDEEYKAELKRVWPTLQGVIA